MRGDPYVRRVTEWKLFLGGGAQDNEETAADLNYSVRRNRSKILNPGRPRFDSLVRQLV